MYIMFCGHPPFTGDTDAEILASVKSGSFNFDGEVWKSVSGDAKNLIKKLLHTNPCIRYTPAQALGHRWVAKQRPAHESSTKKAVAVLGPKIVAGLRSYGNMSKLQQQTLSIIARQQSDDELRQFQDAFIALDKTGAGRLKFVDIKDGLETVGLDGPLADLKQMMGEFMVYTDFMAAMLSNSLYLEEDVCRWPFHILSSQARNTSTSARKPKPNPRTTDETVNFEEFMDAVRIPSGQFDRSPRQLPWRKWRKDLECVEAFPTAKRQRTSSKREDAVSREDSACVEALPEAVAGTKEVDRVLSIEGRVSKSVQTWAVFDARRFVTTAKWRMQSRCAMKSTKRS